MLSLPFIFVVDTVDSKHSWSRYEWVKLLISQSISELSLEGCERHFTRNILVIVSTHIPHNVDLALIALNKLHTCIKIWRFLVQNKGWLPF